MEAIILHEMLNFKLGWAWRRLERRACWHVAVIGAGVAHNAEAADCVIGFLSHGPEKCSGLPGGAVG